MPPKLAAPHACRPAALAARHGSRWLPAPLGLPLLTACLAGCSSPSALGPPRLAGLAVLPAETFAIGPPAGAHLGPGPIHEVDLPLRMQPVQGVSGVFDAGDGRIGCVLDNGFGTRANSPDFLLKVVMVELDPRTTEGGTGEARLESVVQLCDPFGYFPAPIQREASAERWLTGADLDPESIQVAPDGSLWIGDEFGPYLLHFHPSGSLLEKPFPLPGPGGGGWLRAPESAGELPARVSSSGGFEGLALTPDGRRLLPLLEKPIEGDPAGELLLFEFDLEQEAYTEEFWRYRLDPRAVGIGDFQMVSNERGYVIERDSSEGDLNGFKAVFEVELSRTGRSVSKRLVANLLALPDPDGLSSSTDRPGPQKRDVGLGDPFAMPFVTIEGLLWLDDGRLLVVNDNNYPFSVGRHRGTDQPDDTEFVLLEFDR